jgi:hypothetical protein
MKAKLKLIPQNGINKARFLEQAKRAQDFRRIEAPLVKVVRNDINKTFESSPQTTMGGEVQSGESWAKLTDYTLSLHPHRRRGKVLIDTGDLWRSTQVDGAGNRYFIDDTTFSYELTSKKARELQEKRPIAVMHEKLSEQILAVQTKWIAKGEV